MEVGGGRGWWVASGVASRERTVTGSLTRQDAAAPPGTRFAAAPGPLRQGAHDGVTLTHQEHRTPASLVLGAVVACDAGQHVWLFTSLNRVRC